MAILSVDLVESVDLVSVILVVNCTTCKCLSTSHLQFWLLLTAPMVCWLDHLPKTYRLWLSTLEGQWKQLSLLLDLLRPYNVTRPSAWKIKNSYESAGSLEDLEWRPWKVYFRELDYFSFTYMIVLISFYYLMNTRLICVVFVDLGRGKGVEQGLRWLGRVVSVPQVQIYRLIPEQAWHK